MSNSRAPQQDIFIDRGETYTFDVTITDVVTGSAVNLTGHTVELLVQAGVGGTQIAKKTNTVHQDAANGVSRFTLSDTDTMAASASQRTSWVYGIHWTDGTNHDIALQGAIEVRPVPVATI